jgi:catalase
VLGSLALIAIVIGLSAALFAYTAGWFSPRRLTPDKVVAAFSPPNDTAVLGHRRNHAKGICFTGVFEANGAGSELSKAAVFVRGEYPVLALLWQIYSRRFSIPIHFRQCGHRFDGS